MKHRTQLTLLTCALAVLLAACSAESERNEPVASKASGTPSTAGKAKVRVINAAAGAGELDIYAQGNNNAHFDGVNFQTVTGYDEVDAMPVTLEVRLKGQQKALLTVPNVNFEPLKIYTIV